jgi:hypothetical protein
MDDSKHDITRVLEPVNLSCGNCKASPTASRLNSNHLSDIIYSLFSTSRIRSFSGIEVSTFRFLPGGFLHNCPRTVPIGVVSHRMLKNFKSCPRRAFRCA